MKKYPLTVDGMRKLTDKKERYQNKLFAIRQRLTELAASNGLSDSHYHQKLEEKAGVQSELAKISRILQNCEILDHDKSDGIGVGSKVRLTNKNASMELQIVSEIEVDPLKRKISENSPMGKAVLAGVLGAKISIPTPKGLATFVIEEIIG